MTLLHKIYNRYSVWLDEENPRAGIPQWQAQAIMGVLFMLLITLSVPAIFAWLHGAAWNSMIQTATKRGVPVMNSVGKIILIGVSCFTGGAIMLLTAIFCRQRDED